MSVLERVYDEVILLKGLTKPTNAIIAFARIYQHVLGRQSIIRMTPGKGPGNDQIVRVTPFDIAAEHNWYLMDYHGKGAFSFKREPPEPDTEQIRKEHGSLIATLETCIDSEFEQLFRDERLLVYGIPGRGAKKMLYRFDGNGELIPAVIKNAPELFQNEPYRIPLYASDIRECLDEMT